MSEFSSDFTGEIRLDIRDSVPDWSPYELPKAPEGAPNILVILYDDTGMATWSPYGGRVNMPVLDRLAQGGLTYTQWHTTAICSSTRSTFLTGRNHHANGMGVIMEGTNGFPGYSGRIPKECATIGQVLQDNGYSTFWVGKNHNVPEEDISSGGSKSQWPLAMGFDRFYGFLGGETSQWYPDLVEDNRFIEPPYAPQEGYHLSKDLADQAIRMIRDQNASNPSKPWFTWYNPGADHAPHQAPEEYIAKYKGLFDDGYDAYRTWVLQRMIERGILPAGTNLTDFNPMPEEQANPADHVKPWDSLSDDEKRLFSRMAEVFAGFSEYTDTQIGRIIDYLEESGQLENTLIFYCADNGASGEGSPDGSVNENKFFNGFPDDLQENLDKMGTLGSEATYNHYPTGWAAAFSAPFKMFKRYAQYAGGSGDPMIIHWPAGIKAAGEIRHQYHHSVDVVSTILDVIGIEFPEVYRGVEQRPLPGVSMKYSFDAAPDAPTQKKVQYYAMLGTRGIWKEGWKAAAIHAPLTGHGRFDEDEWELYHVDVDRSESRNLAAEHPEKLRDLQEAFDIEARANFVYPLDDRPAREQLTIERPQAEPARDRYVYYPGTTAVPESVAVNVRGRSFKIIGDVVVEDGTQGVIFAHGSRFGGHALFIKGGRLTYVYNFLGIPPEQTFTSGVLSRGAHSLGMEFVREGAGEHGESIGTCKLYVDDQVVASGPMRTQIGKFTLCGDGLCIGYDSADAVSGQYANPFPFSGGKLLGVGIDVSEEQYLDLELEARAALARE